MAKKPDPAILAGSGWEAKNWRRMMPNPTSVPGAKGQPDMDFAGGGFDTMGLVHTKSPSTDYMDRKGNPLQETAPTEVKAWSNDSDEREIGPTANEKNGGRSLTGGGTT